MAKEAMVDRSRDALTLYRICVEKIVRRLASALQERWALLTSNEARLCATLHDILALADDSHALVPVARRSLYEDAYSMALLLDGVTIESRLAIEAQLHQLAP
jgi:hypothetical protein